MRLWLKALLFPAAVALGGSAANAAPANAVAPSAADIARATQAEGVTEARHTYRHLRQQQRRWTRQNYRHRYRHAPRYYQYRYQYRPYRYYRSYRNCYWSRYHGRRICR
jgi:dihydrodipicolinate synthase/N-acetylneuraminate lyase